MAKQSKERSPAEELLHKWALESQGGQASLPDWDAEFSASFPNLWVLLTWDQVGELRKLPGQITFKADGTGWRVTYLDQTAKRSTAVVAQQLLDGLRKLDLAVVHPDTVWAQFGRGNRKWTKKDS